MVQVTLREINRRGRFEEFCQHTGMFGPWDLLSGAADPDEVVQLTQGQASALGLNPTGRRTFDDDEDAYICRFR